MRFILQPLKSCITHASNVRAFNLILIVTGRNLNSVHVQYFDATPKTEATAASSRTIHAMSRAKLKDFDRKVL